DVPPGGAVRADPPALPPAPVGAAAHLAQARGFFFDLPAKTVRQPAQLGDLPGRLDEPRPLLLDLAADLVSLPLRFLPLPRGFLQLPRQIVGTRADLLHPAAGPLKALLDRLRLFFQLARLAVEFPGCGGLSSRGAATRGRTAGCLALRLRPRLPGSATGRLPRGALSSAACSLVGSSGPVHFHGRPRGLELDIADGGMPRLGTPLALACHENDPQTVQKGATWMDILCASPCGCGGFRSDQQSCNLCAAGGPVSAYFGHNVCSTPFLPPSRRREEKFTLYSWRNSSRP